MVIWFLADDNYITRLLAMDSGVLLDTQKNEISMLIRWVGLDPADFSWTETFSELYPDKISSRIRYTGSDFFYSFEIREGSHFAVFSPAANSYIGTDRPGNWQEQKNNFLNWLRSIIKEKNKPGPIKDSVMENHNFAKAYVAAPSPLSPPHNQISARLRELFNENTTKSGYDIKKLGDKNRGDYGKV